MRARRVLRFLVQLVAGVVMLATYLVVVTTGRILPWR